MADNASTLTDSVPQIVITEPTPLPVTNSVMIQNIVGASGDKEVISVVTEPSVATSKADLMPEANFPATADENATSDSDASCSVSVEDNKVQEVAMEVEDGGDLLPPPANEVAQEGLTDVAEGAYASCCRRFDNFSESRFMLVILSVLLLMPAAALMMGSRYMDRCPLSNETPIFVFMMGLLGLLVVLSRMAVIMQKTTGIPQCFDLPLLKSVIILGCMAFILLLCTEMTSFLRISPNFEPGAPNYCHRNFYNFAYWFNWSSLFVVSFMGVLHIPKCRRQYGSQNQS